MIWLEQERQKQIDMIEAARARWLDMLSTTQPVKLERIESDWQVKPGHVATFRRWDSIKGGLKRNLKQSA